MPRAPHGLGAAASVAVLPTLAALAAAGCHPALPLRISGSAPPVLAEARTARVCSTSAPTPPRWLRGAEPGGALVLVGSGAGATLEAAREDARRALDRAVQRYLSVDVSAESESYEAERTDGEVTTHAEALHAESHARTEVATSALEPDAEYWEEVALDPDRPADTTWRVHLHAAPSARDLDRARLARQLARAAARGRRTAVVVAADGAGEDARLIQRTLGRRLAGWSGWAVADAELVARAGLGLDDARRAGADRVVIVAAERHEGGVRVVLDLYDGTGRPLGALAEEASSGARLGAARRLALALAHTFDVRGGGATGGAR